MPNKVDQNGNEIEGSAYDDIFRNASQAYGVDYKLLKAIAKTESNFNPNAKSSAGAMGIMQLMPSTAKAYGVTDPYNPEQNIMGGARYLRDLLLRAGGDKNLALAYYNAGIGNVNNNGVGAYQGYIDKVLGNLNTIPAQSATPDMLQGDEYETVWWGDIVVVVFCLLIAVGAVVFFIGAFKDPIISSVKSGIKKVKGGGK